MLLQFLSFPSLSPQLFPEPIHQSVDERELQHISCVCADIFLCRPECDLSALPGPDLCRDRIRHLCACEYILFRNYGIIIVINQRASTKSYGIMEKGFSPLSSLHVFFSWRTVDKEPLGLSTHLEVVLVLLGLWWGQMKVSTFTQNNVIYYKKCHSYVIQGLLEYKYDTSASTLLLTNRAVLKVQQPSRSSVSIINPSVSPV